MSQKIGFESFLPSQKHAILLKVGRWLDYPAIQVLVRSLQDSSICRADIPGLLTAVGFIVAVGEESRNYFAARLIEIALSRDTEVSRQIVSNPTTLKVIKTFIPWEFAVSLKYAAYNGHQAMVAALVPSRDVSQVDCDRAMKAAACRGHLKIMWELQYGNTISEVCCKEAIRGALQNGYHEVVSELLNTYVLEQTNEQLTLCHEVREDFQRVEFQFRDKHGTITVVDDLKKVVSRKDQLAIQRDFEDLTPEMKKIGIICHRPPETGHHEIVRELLSTPRALSVTDRDATINWVGKNSHFAFIQGLLKDHVILPGEYGTLFQAVAANGQLDIVKMILSLVKISREDAGRALLAAVDMWDFEVIREILNRIPISKPVLELALYKIARFGDISIIRLLMNSGHISAVALEEACDQAKKYGNAEAVKEMTQEKDPKKLLIWAATTGCVNVVQRLLDQNRFSHKVLSQALEIATKKKYRAIALKLCPLIL